jgi:hypothetical protein
LIENESEIDSASDSLDTTREVARKNTTTEIIAILLITSPP